MKRLNFLVIFLIFQLSLFAAVPTVKQLYQEADVVVHIRLDTNALSNTADFTSDLGSTSTLIHYLPLYYYKKRTTSIDSSFVILRNTQDPLLKEMPEPGKEYVVFLKSAIPVDFNAMETSIYHGKLPGNCSFILHGILPFDKKTDKEIREIYSGNSFDRAVRRGDWAAVKRKIRHRVLIESLGHGHNIQKSLEELNEWLRSQATVDKVVGDTCGIHILIYPGWVDEGIRFLSADGPQEFVLTVMLGKVRKWGCIRHKLGLPLEVDKIIFRHFVNSPGILESFRKTCIDYRFQRISNWQNPEGVAASIMVPDDTIQPVSMLPPLIRVKVKLVNQSSEPKYLVWPDHMNDGYEVILFKMLKKEGMLRSEDGEFLEMAHDETLGPSVIRVMPGDSLTAWHSFNDPYCSATDATACHDFSFIAEGNWKIGMVYKPLVMEGDTSRFWKPSKGYREVWSEPVVHMNSVLPAEETGIQARLISKWGAYTNSYGQHGLYNALVVVTGAPEHSSVKPGDTVAFRFHTNIQYLMNLATPRPAPDSELMAPGDNVRIQFYTNFPPDIFTLPSGREIKNFLMSNQMNSIQIERE